MIDAIVTRINGLKWIEESGNEETVAYGSPN